MYNKGNTAQRLWCRCAVRFFGRLCINFAGILTYVKKFVCKMPENMQADVPQSRQAVFVRCCLNNETFMKGLDNLDIPNLLLCAISAAALDLCALVLIIAAYREKSSGKKRWQKISADMELVEQGASYQLTCDEILIGRHASADIRLADMSVSRYHAMLGVSDGVWTITDLGSTSGTFVNGVPVKKKILHANDVIIIGSRRLTLRKRRDTKK